MIKILLRGILLFFAFLYSMNTIYAQETKRSIQLNVANGNSIDFFQFGSFLKTHNPLKPGIGVAYQRNFHYREKGNWAQNTELFYHHYTYVERTFSLQYGLIHKMKLWKNTFYEKEFGIGLQFAKQADLLYEYNGTKWEPTSNDGYKNIRKVAYLGLNAGYDFKNSPIDILIGGNLKIAGPWIEDEIPFAIYKLANLSLRYKF
jgi:hypothetical protein